METLTPLERRILAHLPHWHPDEKKLIKAEGGRGKSIRTYSLPDMLHRLLQDPTATGLDTNGDHRHPSEAELGAFLERLVEKGYAERDDSPEEARWRMAEQGQALLTSDAEKLPTDLPSPAEIKMSRAYVGTDAAAETA